MKAIMILSIAVLMTVALSAADGLCDSDGIKPFSTCQIEKNHPLSELQFTEKKGRVDELKTAHTSPYGFIH
jgi:hypothetical protein